MLKIFIALAKHPSKIISKAYKNKMIYILKSEIESFETCKDGFLIIHMKSGLTHKVHISPHKFMNLFLK